MSVAERSGAAAVVLAFGVVPGSAFAAEPQRAPARGRVEQTEIAAPSLAGNLLGDPIVQKLALYLPPSYDASPGRRYPTVYLFHGYDGSTRTWTTNEPYSWDVP